ncbi:amidohydrolase family protein [Chloroflexota bacterium]
MIIDIHSHGFHKGHFDELVAAGGKWAENAIAHLLNATQSKPQFVDVALRVEQLDRCGIDLQVVTPQHHLDSNLLPGDMVAQLAMARALNNHMAALMEESKGRLLAIGSVPLAAFEHGGRQEMERAINSLGLKAISLPSNLQGKAIDLPEFEPFWAQAAQMGVPVYIHPNDPAGNTDRSYEAEYDLTHTFGWPFETMLVLSRFVFSGLMERHPTLKIVSHHLGGGIPFFWGRINETYDPPSQQRNIGWVLPKPMFDYFSLFYYDTAVGGSAEAIRCAYEVFGAERLVFATDAPWGPGTGESRLEEYPKVIKSLGLSEAENSKIFADNARSILNLA